MPRVANPPVKSRHGRRSSKPASNTTPHKGTPRKMPLNDDAGEKVARLHSRQAQYDLQMDQIKAAVKTPMPSRRFNTYDGEWMKMATDNKINAANSWNFALIDYFHDMSLLKEGDGVNFQKASCTLDGCVKIYTSRVDSVATETGKLLSGLADSGNKKKQGEREDGAENEDDDDEEEGEEGEDGTRRKTRKKARSHESTLAPSFASLQLKKFELEFSVDPLFKKASADFDEGGAKGLLLNHLSIDGQGRIVFDSSDDANATADSEAQNKGNEDSQADGQEDAERFFPNLDVLSDHDICPSLKDFDLGDPSGSLEIPFLRAPEDWRQDKQQSEQPGLGDASGIVLDDDIAIGFDDDDDATITGFDLGGEAEFGQGGEAWARDAALEPMLKVHRISNIGVGGDNNDTTVDFDNTETDPFALSLSHGNGMHDHDNILSYFDNALRKDWAGPEHWKIRRMKDVTSAAGAAAPRQRKEKEPFEINFAADLEPAVAELIYATSSSNSAISLPKSQWKTKGRNLLPDDKHFNSKELLRLFLKPKAKMGLRGLKSSNRTRQHDASGPNNGEMDEAFWASQKQNMDQAANDENAAQGTYDANFFADDDGLAFPHGLPMGDDDDEDNIPFADAREAFSPPLDSDAQPSTAAGGMTGLNALLNSVATPGGALLGGYGSQLVTQGGRRVRPEYVNYARVAKKVDVRRLKEVMWTGMGERLVASMSFNSASPSAAVTSTTAAANPTVEPTAEDTTPNDESEDLKNSLRFTDVMNGLKQSYPEQAMRDISTSYGFICLLHLANEQGLVLKNKGSMNDDWEGRLEEIYVTKDVGAVIEGDA
ncbi:condensin complex component cnd2 [Nannizzia gypsea CBS 118893]|uniref:Condensin complex subunit 2 n=1 Tax=Arthroderma gypseum (strain ATCC MYA-4604 / CBS 118893) TaxID=535722 RepID=E4UX50_ARTGP|nr:condensin complex component cnd2 [Nannizzia gypsea CBS 118893]EFR01850.1 condensin complex component cnd2 [Nannizzia gypsea CBS 118893]